MPPTPLAVHPDEACRRLGHPVQFLALPTGDQAEACKVCTLAYRQAFELGGQTLAEAFVRSLRAESSPYPTAEP
jgi:hypothetical protein